MTMPFAAHGRVEFQSPHDELQTFMQLKGSVRDEAWPLHYFGVIHAQFPDGTSRPLLGFEGLEHARFIPRPDGSFDMLESMVTYFTDLATGDYLSDFANPLTGKRNDVVSNHAAGTSYNFATKAFTPLFGTGYTDPGTGMGLRWFRSADRIWVQYDRSYPDRWWTPASELITFEARAQDLQPGVSGTEAAFSSTTVLPWFKWLEMGDTAGWTLWHANGFKVRSLDALPRRLLDRLARHHPHALTLPGTGDWQGR